MIEFKDSLPQNVLLVGDSRIYRGRMYWMLYGRPHIDGFQFSYLMSNPDTPGKDIPVDIYFVECVIDDCGWGDINLQEELNSTMESLVTSFQSGILVKTIYEPAEEYSYYPLSSENKKKEIIRIYHGRINIREYILEAASKPKNWLLYEVGYGNKQGAFDYYKTDSFSDRVLNKLAHLIVSIGLILSLIYPFYVIYLIFKK